jgi:eukaryotic-like serine/threonine-protein kinase
MFEMKMNLAAGSTVGPYEILGELGSGGMGTVYKARDTRLGRSVAVKVLPAELAADRDRLRRFEQEARAASALNHPNIVTIHDVGSQDGTTYIAMELVEGRMLREVLASAPLPTKKLLDIAFQIADGLAKAHLAGIVHRDLKPENVMISRDGFAKILDFGLAKLTPSASEGVSAVPTITETTPGAVLGTVGYMSPEQASGQAIDFRSDQFSFGAILYEMATGKRAFAKDSAIDTLSAILHEEPRAVAEINPTAPAPLRWLVERCLAKAPEERYGTTGDLARELDTIRNRLPEAAGIGEDIVRSPERRVAAVLISAAALLSLGLWAGKTLWKPPPTSFPRFQQLTFREETILTARFAPDGQTVVYGAGQEGKPFELYSTSVGSLDWHAFGLGADILSISAAGEMAVLLGPERPGTLARLPATGGTPREILDRVRSAAWSPDGKNLAVVDSLGDKRRLEFPIGTVVFESTGFISPPRFSRRGDRILFANDWVLLMADLKTRKVRTLSKRRTLSGFSWAPGEEEIWMCVISGGTSELRGLHPGGAERVLATLPGEFILQDVDGNGRVLLEKVTERTEMLGHAAGATGERNLSWLDGSVPADISADGSAVLFTETGTGRGEVETTYLRRTDGSGAVRLGEGYALALSPDGKWAVVRRGTETILLPTGVGQSRSISEDRVEFTDGATFSPDGEHLLLSGSAARVHRLYRQDLAGGEIRPITPPGVFLPEGAHTISPDGSSVAATDAQGHWAIHPLDGGAARPIVGLAEGEKPVRWSADGRLLFVLDQNGKVDRLDPSSGRRSPWKQLHPGSVVFPTPDGASYVYGYGGDVSNLFLMNGLGR